jgi:flagellar hook-associated protein 2
LSTSTNGTGLIQAMGIGSGLDIQSLVSQLVAAERAPVETRLTRQASDVATRVSALGSLKGAVSFRARSSCNRSTSSARSATSGEIVSDGQRRSDAVGCSYAVEVRQLAQPEQLVSTAFSTGASAVGTGIRRYWAWQLHTDRQRWQYPADIRDSSMLKRQSR